MIKKKCNNVMCNALVPRRQTYCTKHQQKDTKRLNREYDRKRDPVITAFYKSKRWQRFRLTVLKEYHYLCQHEGCNDTADTVHHIIEVKNDWSKRFERENCIPVCRSCHEIIHNRFS